MTASPFDPAVTDEDAAELASFLDGRLPADRHAAVAARVGADPALTAALDRRRLTAAAIATAVAETRAPGNLRRRLAAL
jgi:anti-sigma factor RsiW